MKKKPAGRVRRSSAARADDWLYRGARGIAVRREIARRVALAVQALDDPRDRQVSGEGTDRDRYRSDRQTILELCLQAWRENPLARRIVELTTEYVCGGELKLVSPDEKAQGFLDLFWTHRLNRMCVRVFELCDDLTRSGDLFCLISTDVSGMSFIRAIPPAYIGDIDTSENDMEQETFFVDVRTMNEPEQKGWFGYDENSDALDESGKFKSVMVHFAINRPIGGMFGEPDLAPLLKWLKRHAAWLEDRARLNRFRTAFMWIFQKAFDSDVAKSEKQKELNSRPPGHGSFYVLDDDESLEAKAPNLESDDANLDGLALKKMVMAGAGAPLHFVAEPESATRSTAEEAGGPAFRHYQRRQIFFFWVLTTLARIALRRKAMVDRSVDPQAPIEAQGTDIFSRDNAALANAANQIVTALGSMRDRGLIDDEEYLRMVYRFAGEIVDVRKMLARGKKAPQVYPPSKERKNEQANASRA